MAVSVFKTFNAAEVLTASDLNSSLTQITGGGIALVSPFTGDCDISNQRFDNLHLGTASDPSISFNSDGDTGIYSAGANQVSITVGGNQVANLTATIRMLGNRDANGEFLQRADGTSSGTTSADTAIGVITGGATTFAVAYSGTPVVVITALDTDSDAWGAALTAVSTTAFTPRILGTVSQALSLTMQYHVVGA